MYQIKIDNGKNSAMIDLNRFFYPLHLIQQAASKFRDVAEVSVRENQNRVIVNLVPKGNKGAEPLALHFCNFTLALKRELGEHA